MTGRDDDPISHTGDTIPADDELLRRIEEAFADPRPSIPAREVFARLRARHRDMMNGELNHK